MRKSPPAINLEEASRFRSSLLELVSCVVLALTRHSAERQAGYCCRGKRIPTKLSVEEPWTRARRSRIGSVQDAGTTARTVGRLPASASSTRSNACISRLLTSSNP